MPLADNLEINLWKTNKEGCMKIYYQTDIGNVRNKNEDSLYYDEKDDYIIAIVADGMGGHKSGELASKIAVEQAGEYFLCHISDLLSSPRLFMKNIYANSCKRVFSESKKSIENDGMGTTMTVAIIDKVNQKLYVGNIGDSRAYIIRNSEILQVTEDHSLVYEMFKKGQITKEEIKIHPQKNVLTKALGTCEHAEPDFFERDLLNIKSIILCTDGLTNYISKDEIYQHIISKNENPAEELIIEAKKRGGTDNISIIIVNEK